MVGLGRRSVYSLIAIYETFVEKLGYSLKELSAVDYSKLDRIIPAINVQPVAHRDWFERAKILPRRDLEREVREAQESQTKRMSKPSAPELPDNGLQDWLNTIQHGECLELLRQLPDESIDCCVTSPPYWNLRDFGVEGQLGMEETFHEYIENLCTIFNEVRRVLKPEGTCWVNMGDTYSGTKQGKTDEKITRYLKEASQRIEKKRSKFPDKCLLQIPARFAIEMCNHGWILRNEIIWYKPNAMPASVRDRFTVDFEKLFFFTKSPAYYYERQFETLSNPDRKNFTSGKRSFGVNKDRNDNDLGERSKNFSFPQGRNKRCVWRIPTQPFPEAHFAVFPEALCETPIKASCNDKPESYRAIQEEQKGNRSIGVVARQGVGYNEYENKGYTDCGCNAGFESGIVLDPFCGSGTTLVVASKLKRKYLGFEINPDYVEIARKRLQPT